MLGGTHAATGSLAGVVVAGLLGDAGLVELATGAAVGAGAALLSDLDHPNSTATRSQGPASRAVCSGLRSLSGVVFQGTRTRYDDGCEDDGGRHRHLTHTLPACVAVGALVWTVSSHWIGAAVVLWLLISLGLRGVGQCLTGRDRRELSQWTTVTVGAAVAVVVVMVAAPPNPVLLAAVVATGMVVHIFGDWLTPAGVPLAWPLVHRGKRWWMFRSPLAFRAGDCWQETAVRWVCWGGTPVAALMMA